MDCRSPIIRSLTFLNSPGPQEISSSCVSSHPTRSFAPMKRCNFCAMRVEVRCRLFRPSTFRTTLFASLLVSTACRQDMHNQPRYKPFATTSFFEDGRSARPSIEDTVARGQLHLDEARYTGKVNGKDITAIPIQITREDLDRGHDRFEIYCSPCHGRLGDGQGMIVKRGLRQPPSYHDERLITAPIGHFFDVMTNGYGAM